MTPTFSRVEIRHDDHAATKTAASELRALADKLSRIARDVSDPALMKLAAHAAIREASQKLRGLK